MPNFTFTSPQGKQYTVTAPDGATQEQAFAVLQKQLQTMPTTQPQPGAMPNPDPQNIQQVQQNADQGEANVIDKLKSIGRGFVNTLEQGTDSSIGPARQQAEADVDQGAGLGKPTGGMGEFIGGMASPLPSVAPVQGMASKAAEPGLTLGQLTQNPAVQWLESKLAYLPGGGDIVKSLSQQTQRLGQHVSDIVDSLRGGRTALPEDAGQTLSNSLDTAAQRIKNAAGKPFDDIANAIPAGTRVNVTNTYNTLDELTAVPKGGENMGEMLVSPKLQALFGALKKDMVGASSAGIVGPDGKVMTTGNGQQVALDVLRQWRTRLGNQIDWGRFGSDPDNAALKQVWKSLTSDIMDGARMTNPQLAPAILKANQGYQVAQAQLGVIGSVVNKAGGTENIFNSLMAGTKDGSLTIRRVLAQLSPSDRQLLAATQLRRLGLANPGAQGAAGELFSADSFLTNWNKMDDGARQALFGSLPNDYARNITQIAKSAEQLKSYGRLVRMNTSNTTPTLIGAGEVGSAITGLITGHPGVAAALGGQVATTKALGLALTNPKTAAWLATAFPKYVAQFAPTAIKAGAVAQQSNTP